jgi:hypothetical protein
MSYSIILAVASAIYKAMRPILLKAVNDPTAEWDDALMRIADCVFGYEK